MAIYAFRNLWQFMYSKFCVLPWPPIHSKQNIHPLIEPYVHWSYLIINSSIPYRVSMAYIVTFHSWIFHLSTIECKIHAGIWGLVLQSFSLFSISWQVFQLVYIFWCIYLLTHWIHSINVAVLYLIDSMKRFQNVKLSFCIHLWVCRFWEHLKAIGMNNGCVASDESIDHHEW